VCLVTAAFTPVPNLGGYAGLLVGAAVAFLEQRRGWARHRPSGPLVRPVAGWLAALAALGALLGADLPHNDRVAYLFLCPLVAVLVLHLVHGGSSVTRVLGSPPMTWLGRRSYGIYLVHTLALTVCAKLVPESLPARPVWVAIGCLVLTVMASDAAHRLIEKPFIRLGRQWSSRPGTEPAPVAVAEVAR
jgi:peptidoglycan/LPS O-acetylase OafA/YrhL